VLFTLIENAKVCGLEPYWYLRYLLKNIMSVKTEEEYSSLLPQFVDPGKLRLQMPAY